MITTSQMITLGTSFATLALGTAGQLFEFAMKFFDLPAHVIRFLGNLRDHSLIKIISNDPVNVAVCGNYLE